MHHLAPGHGHGARRPNGHRMPLPDKRELSAHLHDRDHVRHLCSATVILAMNIAITLGVPILGIQIAVVVGLFGREAVTIMLA